MPVPLWFLNAIRQRLELIMLDIERQSEWHKIRAEEQSAFAGMFPGEDKTKGADYMEWEDKHLFRRAVENEWLYTQGVKDGIQLIIGIMEEGNSK
ncbi:hypothetical protein [Paenibacillus antibioticophila]|uniref:hypothetical protein n=1 Tax=Paenibacillus antibioticophila TaxID=1274374 RepID=UPI0005C9F998|nr:hypothetical protein [Paenibacillus antibioticophila]